MMCWQPVRAATASGRSRPCVSEMTPISMIVQKQNSPTPALRAGGLVPVADALERLALLPVLEVALAAAQRPHLLREEDDAAGPNQDDDDDHRERHHRSLNFRRPECQTPPRDPRRCPSSPISSMSK